jgi:hypothetical protein
MPNTYSISTAGQDAVTYTNISQILALLPNNTQELISPKDVRDAIFSNWENSVWRYTSNGTDEYIGFDRTEVKGVPLFLGKKNLNNSNILSNSVLTTLSDTDIFFFNTKSDLAPSQKLKIAFLGGSSQSLYLRPPYLEVLENVGGTPSLDLNLTHTQTFGGDFNFIAGQNGRISLNSFVIPSQNELSNIISLAGSASVGDLMMVRSSTGLVELRNVPTNGVGDIFFTDATPMPDDFRGFVQGETFSQISISDMVRSILYPEYGPSVNSIDFTTPLEKNTTSNTVVNYTYTLTKRTFDILQTDINIFRENGTTLDFSSGGVISGLGLITTTFNNTFTFSGVEVNNSNFFTFSITTFDGTYSSTASERLDFVFPYFYGFSTTTYSVPTIQTTVNGDLTKLIDIQDNQAVDISGQGFLYFAYPSSYGLLYDIKDNNGFQIYIEGGLTASWTQSNAVINSPSSLWSGQTYKVYRTTSQVTITPPSRTYTFNFTP